MNLPSGKLMALLAVFAAIGVITGTGAFTTVNAERTATVNVAGDSSALLALGPTDGPNGVGDGNKYAMATPGSGAGATPGSGGSEGYAAYTGSNTLTINLAGYHENAGSGVNKEATTTIENVFVIQNQGSQTVNVSIEDLDYQSNSDTTASSSEDQYVTFYYIKSNGDKVSLEVNENGNAGISTAHNATLDPGQKVVVSVVVDTTGNPTLNSDSGESGTDLIDDISITAEATSHSSNAPSQYNN